MALPSTNPKMRNIAGRKSSTLGEALLSALASRTAIRLKVELFFADVLITGEHLLCLLSIIPYHGSLVHTLNII